MRDDDLADKSIGGRLARAAALVFSGTVAAVLVLNSGPGCDGPKSEATRPAPAQQAAPPAVAPTPEPVPADSKAAPVPADSEAGPPADGQLRPPAAGNARPGSNVGDADTASPRYFPASKSGVFIEPAPNAPVEPPAREPAVQEDAPPQQQGRR